MNRDAKIGVVVILIIVGLLVIIWGRGEPEPQEIEQLVGPTQPPATSLDPSASLETRDGAGEPVTPVTPALPGIETKEPETTDPILPEKVTTPLTPTPTPAATTWTYTVAGGDSLQLIAQDQLGTWRRYKDIATLNNLAKPYVIRLGQKLRMPPKGGRAPAADPTPGRKTASAPRPEIAGKVRYIVKAGDIGIVQIAREQLGDPRKARDIRAVNQDLRPPFTVRPGDELWLPRYK